MRYGSAIPRSVEYIGVSEHCESGSRLATVSSIPESKKLSDDLREFVEDPQSKGTIYVAFGSIVNWQAGPPHVIQTFVNVFNRLQEYRVIWSYSGREVRSYPDEQREENKQDADPALRTA